MNFFLSLTGSSSPPFQQFHPGKEGAGASNNMLIEMAQKPEKLDKRQFKIIKRMSDDCTIYVGENTSGNFVVVQDDVSQGVFEHQQDAYRLYGVLTRTKPRLS